VRTRYHVYGDCTLRKSQIAGNALLEKIWLAKVDKSTTMHDKPPIYASNGCHKDSFSQLATTRKPERIEPRDNLARNKKS
jgi:hypothetical protein